MKLRGRIDSNQRQIVADLRKAGCVVQIASNIGGGCPDLIAARADRMLWLECKTATGMLTPAQQRWHSRWPGHAAIVRNSEEALKAMGL